MCESVYFLGCIGVNVLTNAHSKTHTHTYTSNSLYIKYLNGWVSCNRAVFAMDAVNVWNE